MSAFERLQAVSRLCPLAFKMAEELVAGKLKGEFEWPDFCFLPVSGWLSIAGIGHDGEPDIATAIRAHQIAAPATWRYTQGVYSFDHDVYEELVSGDFGGKIPCEALLHLPEWCIYIETPNATVGNLRFDGFFALIESDMETKEAELRFFLDMPEGIPMTPIILHLVDGKTVEESLAEANRIAEENGLAAGFDPDTLKAEMASVDSLGAVVKRLLPLVLYVCQEEPEIENTTTPDWLPHNPQPKSIRGEFRLMPAKKPHHYMLGEKTGIQLRQARRRAALEGGPDGRTISPHIRKAHWHGYWTGPRKGKDSANQKFVLKWIPTIIVLGARKNTSL